MNNLYPFSSYKQYIENFKKVTLGCFTNEAISEKDVVLKEDVVNDRISNFINVGLNQILYDFDIYENSNGEIWIAVILKNKIFLYVHLNDKIKLKQEIELDGDLFVVSFIKPLQENKESLMIASGGDLGLVFLINDTHKKCLISDNKDIFCLSPSKPNPKFDYHNIILVGYHSGALIIWDYIIEEQIALFSLIYGRPPFDIGGIDWHYTGNWIISAHLNRTINIWEIDNEIITRIKNKEKTGKPIRKGCPSYECAELHSNFIDNVKFYGDLVISKDSDEKIIIWCPFEEDVFALSCFYLPLFEKIWFTQMTILLNEKKIVVGNDDNQIFFYNLEENQPKSLKKAFGEKKIGWSKKIELKGDRRIVRKILFSADSKYMFCINDAGRLFWKNISNIEIK